MPKRSGSNKLRSSKRSGSRSPKSSSTQKSGAHPEAAARSAPARKHEPGTAATSDRGRDSSPPSAPASPSPTQSLLERFNELPTTTRYGAIGAVVALLIAGAWYFMQRQNEAANAPKPAPTGAELAAPQPVVVPPGIMSALAAPPAQERPNPLGAPASASGPQPSAKPPLAPAPETRSAAPARPPAEPPKTPAPKPAPKPGDQDNPY